MVEMIIYISAIFLVGGLLVLERHCLGQRALVHPLTICLVAGIICDHVEVGIWLGIIMQLFSLTPTRKFDWALGGAVAAILLAVVPMSGIKISVGDMSSLLIALVSILAAMISRSLESRYAQADWIKNQGSSPWNSQNPACSIECKVHRSVLRWFVVGSLEVMLGVGLGWILIIVAQLIVPEPGRLITSICAVSLPAFSIATVSSALVTPSFIIWSGIVVVTTMSVYLAVLS